jgi:hypothetical protein
MQSQLRSCGVWSGFLAAGLLLAAAPAARGAFVMNISQSGTDVVATGSGTINTTALTYGGVSIPRGNSIQGSAAGVFINPGVNYDLWNGFTGSTPNIFGSGPKVTTPTSSGDAVGVNGQPANVFLADSYVSGAALSDSATWANASFASLGLTPGTYVWTWGSGPTADSFTVNIVPEPASLGLLGLCTAGLLLRKRNIARAPGG